MYVAISGTRRGTRRLGCMSGCGVRLCADFLNPPTFSASNPFQVPASSPSSGGSGGWLNTATGLVDLGVKTAGAVKGAPGSQPAAGKGQPAGQQGGLQNWLNSQSNTTLAIGSVAALGLLLAVTR